MRGARARAVARPVAESGGSLATKFAHTLILLNLLFTRPHGGGPSSSVVAPAAGLDLVTGVGPICSPTCVLWVAWRQQQDDRHHVMLHEPHVHVAICAGH